MNRDIITKLPSSSDVTGAEEAIMKFWEHNDVFKKSVDRRPESNPFVFYEGPPTANGRPGVHHVIARLCKDLVCRYKTMHGYRVVRKAGWDTHGLPVEIEVENELGFERKEQIESYGVAEFNARCRESVFRYEKDWVEFTKRIGYWLDMDHPYVTCENRYIETVWWILRQIWDKGLLYEGHKIVPYCPRCETSLSSHEVSQGYADVSDPSIFVKFKRSGADEFFLVWTTTPWTLVSNAALAVGAKHVYARVRHKGETLILAEALLGVLDGEYELVDTFAGADLIGSTYDPLFNFFAGTEGAFRVLGGDFVSLEDGTGIVHIAPAFGEDDYKMHLAEGVPILQPVTPRGTFEESVRPWAGRWIKDADPDIMKTLAEAGRLYKKGKIEHSYPFCWRCKTALIYYARRSWYVRTTAVKDEMIAANKKVNWIPSEAGEFRFGNWLESNVDWSLSRERYWGTPLPVWVCETCGHKHCVGSVDELRERSTNFPEDESALDLHRPMVDALEMSCDRCGGVMKRVAEVIDVWFDSGSMPFAQYHYPFDEEKMFGEQFPADFISEGMDQSRGWFYSLLAISTLLKGESSFKNVLCTEMILDKNGHKMSKSRGNTVDPRDLLNHEGADALRWYLVTTSPPWTPTRFDRKAVVESSQKMLGTLRNVYSFYAMYAAIDRYVYSEEKGEPDLLDRWVVSRFHSTAAAVTRHLDAYDLTRAARLLQSFVLDELSNWYVRRSRRRFWKGEMGPDKAAAYYTLYTVLDGLAKLLAPFTPFLAEEIYLALRRTTAEDETDLSVHLEPYPRCDDSVVEEELERSMETAMTIAALGRTVRNEAKVRIRQPLSEIVVFGVRETDKRDFTGFLSQDEIVNLVLDELNIRRIRGGEKMEDYVSFQARPNFPALGKRFGKRVPEVVKAVEALDIRQLMAFKRTGELTIDLDGTGATLTREEVSVKVEGRDGFGAAEEGGLLVVINLNVTDALRLEGLAREVVNRLQNLRKSAGLEVTDRIRVRYEGGGLVGRVFEKQGSFIENETLAREITAGGADWEDSVEFEVDGEKFRLWISRFE